MDLGLSWRQPLRSGWPGVLAAAGAFAVCALFLLMAGKDPVRAAIVMLGGTLGSADGLYEVITRAVPLTIMGLGVALAFRASVYNIGAEGQYILGAVVAVAATRAVGDLGVVSLPWLLAAGAIGGALFGGLAGVLRARFDANEIIVTIMLNYVAIQLGAWLVRGPMQEAARILPRSDPIPASAQLLELAAGRIHSGIFVAIALVALIYLLIRHTVFGYQLDAVGENRAAAEYGGIGGGRVIVLAMSTSGALCGVAGAVEVSGTFRRLEDNMAPGSGATAIAVALLARLNPIVVPFTALLFGVLTVGAGVLQRQMGVPFPLLWIIEAAVIIAFLVAGVRRGGARTA